MGEILRLQRHWQIADFAVAYRGTSIHYDINGLKAEEFFTNIDAVRPPTPLLYYDILQKSPLFASGAEVGESPHGLEGSYIYVSIIYSIRNPWPLVIRKQWCLRRISHVLQIVIHFGIIQYLLIFCKFAYKIFIAASKRIPSDLNDKFMF
jgi:hypothetical protein